MTYTIRFTGHSWSVWRADGTAIVYRDTCWRTAVAVMWDLERRP